MSDPYTAIARDFRQWFLEDRPTASDYAYAMMDPQILVPVLKKVYARLLRNRRYYLKIEDAGWGRDQPFYKWLRRYFDTTDVQVPNQSGAFNGIPRPLESVGDGLRHLMNQFDAEFAAQDTMLVREKERMDKFEAMNGEDKDCYWSYMGPGGGQHLHSVVTKSVGPDGVFHDNTEQHYLYNRKFNANPTALYGMLLRRQEQAALQKSGIPRTLGDYGRY